MRKDKQLFRELTSEQLEMIVQGLDLLLDKQFEKDLSVLEVRPIRLLQRKALEESMLKREQIEAELHEQRKIIRAASEELYEEPADA